MADDQPIEGELPNRPIGAAPPPDSNALSHDERLSELYPDDPPREEPPKEAPKPDEATPKALPTVRSGEYEITAPEGFAVAPDMLREAAPVFKDIGLTNEAANKLMPLAGKLIERHETAKLDDFSAMTASWAREARDDPQIGRGKFGETMRLARIALNAGGAGEGSEFRELLDESGLGNHRVVIAFFRKLGEQLARAPRRAGKKQSRSEILYPHD